MLPASLRALEEKIVIRRHLLGAAAAAALLAGLQPSFAQSVTLDFPTWQADEPGFGEFYKTAIAAFHDANPDVEIRLQQIPFAEYINQLTVRFASGRPPHILVIPSD